MPGREGKEKGGGREQVEEDGKAESGIKSEREGGGGGGEQTEGGKGR